MKGKSISQVSSWINPPNDGKGYKITSHEHKVSNSTIEISSWSKEIQQSLSVTDVQDRALHETSSYKTKSREEVGEQMQKSRKAHFLLYMITFSFPLDTCTHYPISSSTTVSAKVNTTQR